MRVLVVDDDPASQHVLAAHLAGLADCTMCASGAEAVEAVTRSIATGTPFDVIFLDIIMPHMDGHETLAHIRQVEHEAGLPPENQARTVMVTSMDDEANTMAALFDGQVSAYLVKPPNKAELLRKLEMMGLL
jgi:two-component system, chemotaxis family, chemotaxis protein CheY